MNYYGAAICEEGHVISMVVGPGEKVDNFCEKCMTPVHTKCLNCGEPLRGCAKNGAFVTGKRSAPNGCRECGKPYPWTLRLADRAKRSIDLHGEEQNVSPEDVEAVKSFADDLARGLASEAEITGMVTKVKKFGKAGPIIWNEMKDIGTSFAAKLMGEIATRMIRP